MSALHILTAIGIGVPLIRCLLTINKFIKTCEAPVKELLEYSKNVIETSKATIESSQRVIQRADDILLKLEGTLEVIDTTTVNNTNKLLSEACDLIDQVKKTAVEVHGIVETVELVPLKNNIKWAKHKTATAISSCVKLPKTKNDESLVSSEQQEHLPAVSSPKIKFLRLPNFTRRKTTKTAKN